MNTTTDTRPLAERITKGEVSLYRKYTITPASKQWETVAECPSEDRNTFAPPDDEREANAELIVEAFNVTHETGRTPRQLADDIAGLIAALKTRKRFYGSSTEYCP